MTSDHLPPPCAAQYFGAWCVEPDRLSGMVDAVKSGALAPTPDRQPDKPVKTYGTAVIPISGMMVKGDSSFEGAVSTLRVRHALRTAAADPDVDGIMLLIDSGGGTVAGTEELADEVARARKSKRVVAHVDDMACSAAYWVASQAERITANSTALVGSLGTLAVVHDTSGMAKAEGIKVHVISTGPHKGARTPGSEVTDEQLADVQRIINETNEHFVTAVREGRGLSDEQTRAMFTGQVWLAEDARQRGLINEVASFDEAIASFQLENTMTREQFEAFAAQNTDAVTAIAKPLTDAAFERGKLAAAPKAATLTELKAAFGEDKGFIIDASEAGHSVDQAKAAYADVLKEKLAAAEADKAKLQARIDEMAGGAAPVSTPGASAEPASDDPASKAAADWTASADLQKRFPDKDRYVAVAAGDTSAYRSNFRKA